MGGAPGGAPPPSDVGGRFVSRSAHLEGVQASPFHPTPHLVQRCSRRGEMPAHGYRSAIKGSAVGGFACVVCGVEVNRGDRVVGFRNCNRGSRNGWDHAHAEVCANRYRSPPLIDNEKPSASSQIKSAISGAWKKMAGITGSSTEDGTTAFTKRSRAFGFTDAAAREILEEYNGDEEAAVFYMADQFMADTAHEWDRGTACENAAAEGANSAGQDQELEQSSDEEMPPAPEAVAYLDSSSARAAVYDVFHSFIQPMLPKPQSDGGFKDGDPTLLDSLMSTPSTLALPRAERLSDLIRPQLGWDQATLLRCRDFFSLAAAGVEFLIFLPTITHRSELARSPLFCVKRDGDKDGETVGVRDCCPHCRSNQFVNVTDGTYNIRYKQDASRNGVRFIHGINGVLVPIARSAVCRNPCCPPNVSKLQARNVAAPRTDKQLPRGKAPDGRPWPSTSFSTHSDEYINLVAEALPSLGAIYKQYKLFDEGGCDAALAAKVMQTSSTVAQLCKELQIQSQEREKAVMHRYLAYAQEQQLQGDESLPHLPSPLELSRASIATQSQQPTQHALTAASNSASGSSAIRFGSFPPAERMENDLMRRFFTLMPQVATKEIDSDDDGATITTTDANVAPQAGTARATRASAATAAAASAERAMVPAARAESTTDSDRAHDGTHDESDLLKAPAWRFVNGTASVLNVSEPNIRTIMRNVHRILKPYITADLLKREPGEFASHDHTFKIATRALGDAKAYAFFMGEDHSIIWHGAVKTTSWDELMPALEALQKRFERLGVSGKLKYMYDDLCCRGKSADKLREHPVVDVFPGVDRCPRKDGFHACQLVTQTFNAGTGEVDVHARDVGATLRPTHEPDLQKAIAHLVESEQLPRSEARREAMKRYRGTGILRTYGPQPSELRVAWQHLIDRLRSDRDAKGARSIVRAEYGTLKGTVEQMEDMFQCIDKGCYSDPLKVKRMYIAHRCHADCSTLIYRVKKSESVKNETVHKGANRLVQDISRMGEDMLDIRIDFFVLAHNLKCDARRGLRDAVSLGLPHEMAFIAQLARKVLQGTVFPCAAANADVLAAGGITEASDMYEPHGAGYYKHVEKIEADAKAEARAKAAQSEAQAVQGVATRSGGSLPLAKPAKASGKRATKARKGVTKNLLNETPLKPTTQAEVRLMLKCVSDAHAAGRSSKRRKISVWQDAADRYRNAFIENCTLPDDERLLIRSCTSAEMIEASYVAMSTNNRAFVAHTQKSQGGSSSAADSALPALPAPAGTVVASVGEVPPNDESKDSGEGAAKSGKLPSRARWQMLIDSGRVLTRDEVSMRGIVPITAYLRAMGVTVTRAHAGSVDRLREMVLTAMDEMGVSEWSKGVQAGVQA